MTKDKIIIYNEPALLLAKLIHYNTSNPPGNEKDCILFIKDLLASFGINGALIYKNPERLNLIARLKGKGDVPPLLFYGHADVVGVQNQKWSKPPFEGIIDENFVWGRGAIDMKGAIAMMLCALLKTKVEGFVPKGDMIFAVFSDEEEFSEYGARYVVENHNGLFNGVQHAVGEIGGFSFYLNNKRFYPIMVCEKQKCSLKITIKGIGGHGSIPVRKQAMAKLSYVLRRLDRCKLPIHINPVVIEMINNFSNAFSFPVNILLKGLTHPLTANFILNILGPKGEFLNPLLHNTANATIIKTGNKINVVPGVITIELDGRLLPGLKPEDLICELTKILGKDFQPEVIYYSSGPEKVDMELYPLLSQLIIEADCEAVTTPYMISGCTDNAHLSKLGIQTYGFTPLLLPPDLDFSSLFHGTDERVPIKALNWGTGILLELIKRYGRSH